MANAGFLVPRPSKCPQCKGGRVGMDECEKCAGSGTVFMVKGKYYPDTREGYDAAERSLNCFDPSASGRALAELVIEEGLEFQKLEMQPLDERYLELRKFTDAEIMRAFAIPRERIERPWLGVADVIEMLKPR